MDAPYYDPTASKCSNIVISPTDTEWLMQNIYPRQLVDVPWVSGNPKRTASKWVYTISDSTRALVSMNLATKVDQAMERRHKYVQTQVLS